ncbi:MULTISPECIES: hypothetical protein [Pedobacter]|uniref:hypothetical protein n=1 Tax=Pedobacter TaxID=84567 RepID=UPI0011F6A1FE|nr:MULTISPECIES: hypothetical protein [Pedobacter]RZL20325.1 MAG: hypothetical protein EOO96_25215 [Pedobacter sp.]
MKNILTPLIFTFIIGSASAQKPKMQTFQLMEPNFNKTVIEGTISEVYNTQRYGKTLWWVRLGNDTLVHVWEKHFDNTSMKVGEKKKFTSIKRLDSNWWMKEKSEVKFRNQDTQNVLTVQ